jgi:carbonic anhydrase/acetyltransferase-like protein (isoleucine patch superfamily)
MNKQKQWQQQVKTGKEVFIAPSADVLGDVTLGDYASVWFGAVLRGDFDKITIGERSNVQDNATIHMDEGDPTHIGDEVIVGHNAIVHGATVDDNSLIGMQATALNNAKIGKYCIVGANSLVTAGTEIPDYSLVLGSPAKVVKELSEEQVKGVEENAEEYVEMVQNYLNN